MNCVYYGMTYPQLADRDGDGHAEGEVRAWVKQHDSISAGYFFEVFSTQWQSPLGSKRSYATEPKARLPSLELLPVPEDSVATVTAAKMAVEAANLLFKERRPYKDVAMHLLGLPNGSDGPPSLRKRDCKRRLTSPKSPLLEKLPGGERSSPQQQESALLSRVKDRREEGLTLRNEVSLHTELQSQQQQCRQRFLGRWHHIRGFYAVVSETTTAQRQASMLSTKPKLSLSGLATSPAPAASSSSPQPAPLHTLTAMPWLIDVARELRQGFATHHATISQLKSALTAALRLDLPSKSTSGRLDAVFQAFKHEPEASTVDYREILSALFVLDRWQEGERKMVKRWFQEFAFPLAENSRCIGDTKMAVHGKDLQRMILTACGDEADEKRLKPFVTELLEVVSQQERGNYLSEMAFWTYADSHPKLLETVKTQCWKRLTDDTRLSFYRDLYLHAKARFVHEEVRAKLQNALGIWIIHESSRRFTLWKLFTADRKLFRRSDAHFRARSSVKTVQAFTNNRRKRLEMRRQIQIAVIHRNAALVRWTLHPWTLFWRSMQLMCVLFVWERSAGDDLFQMGAERAWMAAEDALGVATAAQERQIAELARQRSFQEASQRAHVNAKLQKQKQERTKNKATREQAVELEARQAWTAIGAQVATEVRAAALIWLETEDAKLQVHAEATRLFELDAKWIREQLQRDPINGSASLLPPGCRWQLYLETPHGVVTKKLTKAFYLNTETYEKFWCDELIMEESEAIAREILIQWRVDEAFVRLREKEQELVRQRLQHTAAVRIQMLFLCRKARLVARRMIRNTIVKRVDPKTGAPVYFNLKRPHESRFQPPKLLGRDEALLLVESSTWVYREDDAGVGYYERLDTGERSIRPPDHYILCTRCTEHLVTRRLISTGERYCIGCYARMCLALKKRNGNAAIEEGAWTKMPV
ncbi:hypothetical protein BBJ28_00023564, partial [Nothophytophthora sp. Chile5]